jgi:hypothetical protein
MNCDACGVELIDGEHPKTVCTEKEWAIHQARLLGQIVYLLKQNATAPPSAQSATSGAAKQKG